jgi:hypothetical protein
VIARPYGRRQTIVVNAVADRHVAKAEARLLYDDQTPRATPAELEQRRLERMYRAAATPTTRPHRRDRRALRRLSGKS